MFRTQNRSRLLRHPTPRLAVTALLVIGVVAACGAPDDKSSDDKTGQEIPAKPAKPVDLDILDVAGNLQLTQGMIDDFRRQHPDIVGKVTYSKAPAPDLAGKIKAQQQAGRVQIDLVLTGTDGLAAGLSQDLWSDLAAHKDVIGTPDYLPPAADMAKLAQGKGQAIVYYPSGPLVEYDPGKVAAPPKTPQALLAWAKAHPKRFQYADPANSGPGRTWLMGLPYLLGDKDPADPEHGWDKTWAYLKELDKYAAPYASGTTETMKNLASGQVDMIMSTTGWYINPRALGTVPKKMAVGHFDDMTWVTDAQYAVVPKGVSADVMSADLNLIKWILTPKQQAKAYDDGYFYPGPAVRDVPLSLAPAKSRKTIETYGNKDFDSWIDQFPKKPSLPAEQQVTAFDLWSRNVAGG
ncbi:ABC transporter substrate-binding protein [Streptomyces sp. NBC_00588]|uniref:ABC transporter substrate-binding protein n=1 Tax=Streptomyces sp. NBC_00588 TaxID=2975784 RepID=UPI002E807ED4|nr:extracellular solute-binding protein [Streptomyces sp. NBC_00588]WUB35573.1 extracellular solute-binding protein [Streptomyces sp. NBC_00588]